MQLYRRKQRRNTETLLFNLECPVNPSRIRMTSEPITTCYTAKFVVLDSAILAARFKECVVSLPHALERARMQRVCLPPT